MDAQAITFNATVRAMRTAYQQASAGDVMAGVELAIQSVAMELHKLRPSLSIVQIERACRGIN